MTRDAGGSHLPLVALMLLICSAGFFAVATFAWQPEIVLAGLVVAVASACLLLAEVLRH